ncbi:alpha/beta hydrolase [Pseudonocardia sp. TRM90224]|uniref:alpha/beta hydrolase n=1 Tax=Pseudonocardia sp. TRM90224 TaxID=2812678 RepID=UPI001E3948CD|nr:alpha/beta hydrolase [Pseudonocardia sp. TRM90224]
MSPRRTLLSCVVFVSAFAIFAACAPANQNAAVPSTAAPAPPDPLQRFYTQQLSWGPCADYATSESDSARFADEKFDCARLEVPLDYAAPEGRTASIAVLRQKAAGPPAQRIGSLLFNPGGPGGSGMGLVASLAGQLTQSPAGQRFDLIGFDPRGVGASTPAIDCLTDADWAVERADLDVDPSPAGVEQSEAENRQYAQWCTERSGGPEVLANAGTRDVVKDVDILRATLGDPKLNYVGFSYGTRIGSQYAEAFPQNVRALVLDGALDPTQTTIDRTVEQNAGFQLAFDAFAADCAKSPTCPLGTDPSKATAVFQALARPLIDKPIPVGNRILSFPDAITGTVQALYAKAYWPVLTRGIAGLATGDGRILLALGDQYYDRGQDGVYGNNNEAFISISCVDEERITDRAVQADLIRRANEAAPFRDDGRGAVGALDPCAFWPAPPSSKPHVPHVEGLPATLIVSTTGDPATPYQAGVDLAKGLKGSLLTFEGNQHTVALQGNRCIDAVVNAYLTDLKLPPDGTRCADR